MSEQRISLLEQAMWAEGADFHALLAEYQALHRAQDDAQHHFMLSIPVADRPPHLRACLESIFQLCEKFGYDGKRDGVYRKIQIIVAEDSREPANIQRHLDIIAEYQHKGLQIHHFGLEEQYDLLHALPDATRERLGHLLTTQPREQFYRKGQAANRNLSYLKFLQLTQDKDNTLYYLVDSDQHFCVNRQGKDGEEVVIALPYFHIIDRIFRNTDTLMLSGKMVGDPPVSPSVMAVNFMEDVQAFFTRLASLCSDAPCTFHDVPSHKPGAAAYHDLAKLFGFEHKQASFDYACRLHSAHDHAACLQDFTSRLNDFFFGEHLTRKTWFDYGKGLNQLSPARTLYPGNYVVNYAGLRYIIPFGHLRLRMSGPTAGRLIAAEIGPRFATCNLPNLHCRTSEEGLHDDFRPGVELNAQHIDLSDEFERQFFGDLMLFSTEELVKRADVNQPFPREVIEAIIAQKEAELLALYQQKHDAIVDQHRQLSALVLNQDHWWANTPAMQQVQNFLDNIKRNFGEHALAWQQIQSTEHRTQRKTQIIDALLQYRNERKAWDSIF